METQTGTKRVSENANTRIMAPKMTKALDEIVEDIQEQKQAEELERIAAEFQEKLRRDREGTPPNYQAYYEAKNAGVYYYPDASGNWTSVNESGIKRYLMIERRISAKKYGKEYSSLDLALHDLQTHYHVGYAGKLAGYPAGIRWQNGERILVTNGPTLIEPVPGEFSIIAGFLDGLLAQEQAEQRTYFDCWLKIGVEALRNCDNRPGQALVLAGPKDCGKSFIQNHIITPLLGGRMAKPYLHFCGATPFNGELLEAVHLMIEDDIVKDDFGSRRNFGNKIKQVAANEGQVCHAKHKQALTLFPLWRISISCNDEPEQLMILPPMDPSLEDKLILLKATKAPMPMPSTTGEERRAFCEAIERELPHYLHHLLSMKIPLELEGGRFGVKAYQNAELMARLNELSAESQLLEIIDTYLQFEDKTWKGTARELRAELELTVHGLGGYLRDILTSPKSCGKYLSRLTKTAPNRVRSTRSNGMTHYTITAPEDYVDRSAAQGVVLNNRGRHERR